MRNKWASGPPAHRRVPVVDLMLALPYESIGPSHAAAGNRATTLLWISLQENLGAVHLYAGTQSL